MAASQSDVKRDLSIVVLSRVVQMGLLVLTLRAMTSRLTPTQVGDFSLLVSISTLFVWPLISPIGLYVNRHTLQWLEDGSIWRNYLHELLYVFGVAAFAGLTLSTWQYFFKPSWAAQFTYLGPAMMSYIVFSVANTTIIPAINLLRLRIAYTILFTITQLIQLMICWLLTGDSPFGQTWFWGQTAGFALGFLVALPHFLKSTRRIYRIESAPHDYRADLRDVAAFSIPIAVTLGLNWVQFQSYRFVIGNFVSLKFLGLFFAGYTASGGIMAAFEATATQFFGPYFYKHVQYADPDQRHDAWCAYISILYPLMLVVITVAITLSSSLAHVLLSKQFASAGPYIAVGAIVEGIRVLANTYALAAQASKRTTILLLPYSIGGGSVAFVLVGGVSIFGRIAVAPAMVLSALLFLITMHVTMVRHTQKKIRVLGLRWVIGAGVFLTCLRVLASFLFPPSLLSVNIGLLAIGGLIVGVACLLIARDALSVVSEFG